MNKRKIFLIVIALLAVAITIFFVCKDNAIKFENDNLIYNNSVYHQISCDSGFGQNMMLFSEDRIDLQKVLVDKKSTYVWPKSYYVYKGDSLNSPNIIFEENGNVIGSEGWLWVKDGFNYADINYKTGEITEVFVEYIDTWSTDDEEIIAKIKTAVDNKEDLLPIISEYTNIEWTRLFF